MRMVERWSERIRSDKTRKEYVKIVRYFLKFHRVKDKEALGWSVEEAEDRIVDFRESLLKRGLTGGTVKVYVAAVKRLFWDHRLRVYVDMRNIPDTKKNFDYIPSRCDVQTLLDSVRLHHKVGVALMAFSGLRPEDATGLQYRHIKASIERGDEVLTILKRHSKSRTWYASFIGTQGARYVRQNLTSIESKGHDIDDGSFLVSKDGSRILSTSLSKVIRRAIKRTVGYHPTGEDFRRFRPYGLRKYFRRSMSRMGESEAEYLMGHSRGIRGIESTYNGLRDLDPQAIEALKKKYIAILSELETEVTDTTLKAQLEKKEKERKRLAEDLGDIREELDEIKEFIREMRR